MFRVGDAVKTPYGDGTVTDLRHEQIVVQPSKWDMAGGQKATLYLNVRDVKPLFVVGDVVRTLFGIGDIIEIRTHGVPYVIKLHEWQLASAKSPVLYLGEHSIKKHFAEDDVVKKEPVEPKKSFEEKFALVKANKDEGNKLFKAGKFDDAKEKYAETINNLNYLSDTSTDEQRSHLFEQTLSCHSNMAVCFLRLQRYTECFNMARSTLYLVDSFENLYPHSKMWQYLLSRGFSIETLLKVWKKKALYLMGKSAYFKHDYQDAVTFLEKAHALIAHDPRLATDAKDIVELIGQSNARLQKQNKSEKNMWKKAFSKQVEEETETEKLVNNITGAPVESPAPSPAASSVTSTKKKGKKKGEKKKKESSAVVSSSWGMPLMAAAAAAVAIAGVVWFRSRAGRR